MAAQLLAIPIQDVLGEAALQSHRSGPCHPGVAARGGVAARRTPIELGSGCHGTSQIATGEDRVPDATVDGATIHYESSGQGFPLVLLHGIGSSSRSWRRQLDALSSGFKVVAWDAPGYGGSSNPDGKPSMRFYAECL